MDSTCGDKVYFAGSVLYMLTWTLVPWDLSIPIKAAICMSCPTKLLTNLQIHHALAS